MFKQLSITCLFLSSNYYLLALPVIAENSIAFNSTTISPPISLTPNTALPDTLIGKVTVKSGSVNGFIVNVQSMNGGSLRRSSGELISYTLSYNGVDQGQLPTIGKSVENVSNMITDCADENGCTRDIKIAISQTAIAAKPAGSYSDQLTFTLIAK